MDIAGSRTIAFLVTSFDEAGYDITRSLNLFIPINSDINKPLTLITGPTKRGVVGHPLFSKAHQVFACRPVAEVVGFELKHLPIELICGDEIS